jgi:hypothetical protein
VAAALKDVDAPIVGVAGLGLGLVELLKLAESPRYYRSTIRPDEPKEPGAKGPPPKLSEQAKKAVKALTQAVAPLPPTVLSLTRKTDSLVLEVRQPGLRGVSKGVLGVWVEAALERSLRGNREFERMPIEEFEKKP